MIRPIAAVTMFVALAAPLAAQDQSATSPTVSTQGRASRKVAPDQAWITVAAESRASKTADAQRQNATAIDNVRASLKQAGVPEDAVKTQGYSLQPDMQFNNGKSTVIGYIARQSLEIRVDDLARLGAIIDAAGGSGATSIAGIRYDVKDRNGIETTLLTAAVRDGFARAQAMAAGAGKTALSVWRIDEQRIFNGPQPMYRMASAGRGGGAAMETQISPDELEIQANVSITVIIR